jgi:hypothetical protein
MSHRKTHIEKMLWFEELNVCVTGAYDFVVLQMIHVSSDKGDLLIKVHIPILGAEACAVYAFRFV